MTSLWLMVRSWLVSRCLRHVWTCRVQHSHAKFIEARIRREGAFCREALSSGHAWIIGAVNSTYRTVLEVLAVEKRDDLIEKLVELWGTVDEVELIWYKHS